MSEWTTRMFDNAMRRAVMAVTQWLALYLEAKIRDDKKKIIEMQTMLARCKEMLIRDGLNRW